MEIFCENRSVIKQKCPKKVTFSGFSKFLFELCWHNRQNCNMCFRFVKMLFLIKNNDKVINKYENL